jgi:hypothetical protein
MKGVKQEEAMIGTFGHPCQARDGHYCDSKEEAAVDDSLYELRIPHERNVYYPSRKYRADWGIPRTNILIEYFGLSERPDYAAKIEKKRQLARDLNIKLVEIDRKDLHAGRVKDILIQEVANALDELPPDSPLVQEQEPLIKEIEKLLSPARCDVILQEEMCQTGEGSTITYFTTTTPSFWLAEAGDKFIAQALEEKRAVEQIVDNYRKEKQKDARRQLEGIKSSAKKLLWRGKKLRERLRDAEIAIDKIEVIPNIIRNWDDLDVNHPLLKRRREITDALQSIEASSKRGFRIIIGKRPGGYVALQPGRFFSHQFKPAIRAATKEQTLEMVVSALREARRKEIDKLRERAIKSLPWPKDLEPEFNKAEEAVASLDRYTWVAEGGRVWWNPFTWFRPLSYTQQLTGEQNPRIDRNLSQLSGVMGGLGFWAEVAATIQAIFKVGAPIVTATGGACALFMALVALTAGSPALVGRFIASCIVALSKRSIAPFIVGSLIIAVILGGLLLFNNPSSKQELPVLRSQPPSAAQEPPISSTPPFPAPIAPPTPPKPPEAKERDKGQEGGSELGSRGTRTSPGEGVLTVGHVPVLGTGVSYINPIFTINLTMQAPISDDLLAVATVGFGSRSTTKQDALGNEVPVTYMIFYSAISAEARLLETLWIGAGAGVGVLNGQFYPDWQKEPTGQFQELVPLLQVNVSWTLGSLMVSLSVAYPIPYTMPLQSSQ